MERSRIFPIVTLPVFLLLLTYGCGQTTYNARDIVAARADLDTLYLNWCHDWCDHDLDGYLAVIDKDAVFLGWPTEQLLAGKPLIEQAVRQQFQRTEKADMNPSFNRDHWLLHVTPIVAWAEASITISFDTPAGVHNQHYLESMVFERRSDGWKVVQYQRSAVTQKSRP
ncbi:MAG: nuclear transport factor 2 family protein [bacterium]